VFNSVVEMKVWERFGLESPCPRPGGHRMQIRYGWWRRIGQLCSKVVIKGSMMLR
jgi:hypothetical protein